MKYTRKWILAAGLSGFAALMGCSDDKGSSSQAPGPEGNEPVCVGKCDSASAQVNEANYTVNMEAANAIWNRSVKAETLADLYSVVIKLPNGLVLKAPTHLFGGPVNPIPYADSDGSGLTDVAGNPVQQGDRELAKFFPPGEIGYAIKNHRPEYDLLNFGDLEGAGADGLKEDLKLQDTHIELVVGVQRPVGGEMVNGVITLNNPQNYQSGRFGNAHYPMIFVKPSFPSYAPSEVIPLFKDNIRTMMLGFNAVSEFPGDYNGGDPLAAHSPEKVREHVGMMVKAMAGDTAAQDWFRDPNHMIYCAELAHVATSAGLLVPLNQAGLVDSGLVDQATFDAFADVVKAHSNGEETLFTQANSNHFAQYVDVTMAPAGLKALPAYGDAGEGGKIAFQPMTMADIVEGFLKTHIPRNVPELGGEALAPLQAAVLKAMKPGLFEAMGLNADLTTSQIEDLEYDIHAVDEDIAELQQAEEPNPERLARFEAERIGLQTQFDAISATVSSMEAKRAGADAFFEEILAVVGKSYGSYDEFRAAYADIKVAAAKLTGPRDGTGTGFFVPPSALHLVAQKSCDGDDRCGGLVGLDYVGHGVHVSVVEFKNPPPSSNTWALPRLGEVMARPNYDYNEDGEVNVRDDEYVMLVNHGNKAADLSGWQLADKVKVRFTFPEGAELVPGKPVYVYGKTDATNDTTFSAGALGLNNNGDKLSFIAPDGSLVDSITWGASQVDQVILHAEEE